MKAVAQRGDLCGVLSCALSSALWCALSCALSCVLAVPAWAALGGAPSLSRVVARTDGYTLYQSDSGAVTVQEYADARSGVVFAVTWRGPGAVDLALWLSDTYPRYQAALAQAERGPGRFTGVRIKEADLSMDTGGHLRSAYGRAILLQALPTGVRADHIQP